MCWKKTPTPLENSTETVKMRKKKIQYATLHAVSRDFSVAEAVKFIDIEEPTGLLL